MRSWPAVLSAFALGACAEHGLAQATVLGLRGGHAYFLTPSPSSPQDARSFAATLGGHLVTINDAEENRWLSDALSGQPGNRFWIGLSDEVAEGVFLWDSGEPVTYTNWFPNEPNNDLNLEDWVLIYPHDGGRWNDGKPFDLQRSVVEVICPTFATRPELTTACPRATASIQVVASSAGGGNPSFAWQREDSTSLGAWLPLTDGPLLINSVVWGTIAGARTPSLTVSPDPLNYYTGSFLRFRCVISNSCGSATSDLATLSVCLGDFNCDAAVDGDDVIAFFTAWDAGEIAADVTGDGSVDGDDVIAFFGAWDAGC